MRSVIMSIGGSVVVFTAVGLQLKRHQLAMWPCDLFGETAPAKKVNFKTGEGKTGSSY